MAQATEPRTRDTAAPALEVERFELADGDRLVLVGRWSGIRGRRFMRPTLTFLADGRSHRLLADLRDKPWAAEDGTPWRASFPWTLDGADVSDAELSVATDIVIPVHPPGSSGAS